MHSDTYWEDFFRCENIVIEGVVVVAILLFLLAEGNFFFSFAVLCKLILSLEMVIGNPEKTSRY